jgi:hypothetical protein
MRRSFSQVAGLLLGLAGFLAAGLVSAGPGPSPSRQTGESRSRLQDPRDAVRRQGESLPQEAVRAVPDGTQGSRTRTEIRKISYELAFGEGSPYSKQFPGLLELPYPESLRISKQVLGRITRIALKETRGRRIQSLYGPGGWERNPVHPSAQLDIRASEGDALQVMGIIGYLAQQTSVIASRPSSGGRLAALQIMQHRGRDLAVPDSLQRWWRRLGELEPRLQQGFLPVSVEGCPGIRIIDARRVWREADYPYFERAVQRVAGEMSILTTVERLRVDLLVAGNDWNAHPDGRQYLEMLGSARPRLRERLVHTYQPRVARWIEAAFQDRSPAIRQSRAWNTRLLLVSLEPAN